MDKIPSIGLWTRDELGDAKPSGNKELSFAKKLQSSFYF